MNQTHIHLLLNHLPILGSFFGGIVLAFGLWTRSNETKIAAYILFILSSIGAVITFTTGEGAEESVENIKGIVESNIKVHEEFAFYALILLIILGISSLVGLILTIKKHSSISTAAFVVLFISQFSFILVARTGYLGGKIRHTEISTENISTSSESENETDD